MSPNPLPPFLELLSVVKKLRDPVEGCPWDREQTHESLSPYLREEVLEFLEDLTTKGPSSRDTHEELGDLLYQVLIHAELLSEKGYSDFFQIAENLRKKLVERHPHVFDPKAPRFQTAQEVSLAWEKLKAKQKQNDAPAPQHPATFSLEKIPKSLGALQVSQRMGEKLATFGFDWSEAKDVRSKVKEELEELNNARTKEEIEEEAGDLLFSVSQYCRKLGIDAENALSKANKKFQNRVKLLEEAFDREKTSWDKLNLEQMELYWQKIKKEKAPTKT